MEALLALLQVLPEADAIYTPVMKKGTADNIWRSKTVQQFGREVAQALQLNAADSAQWNARCKRALILADWVAGESLQTIEARYTTNAFQGEIAHGHVRAFADIARLHLRSAYEIASLLLIDRAPNADEIDNMLKQLELGVPADSLALIELPFQLARGEHLTLFERGVTTPDRFWRSDPGIIKDVFGETLAAEIERHRPT